MRPFTWLAPDTTADALALLREHAPGARVIAGGQSLLLAMKDRSAGPSHLVSLGGIADLAGVASAEDGSLVVGAATTYTTLARTALPGWHRVLAEVAGDLADRPVRNRGTIGGALCTADPRYDMPALTVGVGATLRVSGAAGDRTVAAEEFLLGPGRTVLGPDEILTAVVLPPLSMWDEVAFEKFRHRVFDAAIASVVCALRHAAADGTPAAARLAVGGATPTPVTAPGAARLLADGSPVADLGAATADEVLPGGGADEATRYRHELVRTLVSRATARLTDPGSA
jgi:carbon-monoxide dehydrogenase medium subunit